MNHHSLQTSVYDLMMVSRTVSQDDIPLACNELQNSPMDVLRSQNKRRHMETKAEVHRKMPEARMMHLQMSRIPSSQWKLEVCGLPLSQILWKEPPWVKVLTLQYRAIILEVTTVVVLW